MAERARPGLAALILTAIFAAAAAFWPRLAPLPSTHTASGLLELARPVTRLAFTSGPEASGTAPVVRRTPPAVTRVATLGATPLLLAVETVPAVGRAAVHDLATAPALDSRAVMTLAAFPAASMAPEPDEAHGLGHGFARAGRSLASAFTRTGLAVADAFRDR
ncbi:MAG: hypothetical protein AB7O67_21510 [Vicinamibacterales bacterium]